MQTNGVARTLKNTHIKGRLLDLAVILFKCVRFENQNFSYRNEFAPRGSEFFPLRAIPYSMKNKKQTFIALDDLPSLLLFYCARA